MAEVKFEPDHMGLGQLLNSQEMLRAITARAEEIRLRAEIAAPVYTGSHGNRHTDVGRYKRSFKVRSHRYGGATNDRAEAVVYNDAPEAPFVEFGHSGAEPEHVLLRAAFGELRAVRR